MCVLYKFLPPAQRGLLISMLDLLVYVQLALLICRISRSMTDIAVLNFISAYTSINNMFMVRLFIVNTIISPSKDPPTSNIIDKNIIVTFTETTGTVGYASFGDFTISTDNSIWPY